MTRPEMVALMRPWAARYAETILPAPEAEDAAQEALIAVWQASGRLADDGRDPWPLLTTAARWAIRRYARKFYRRRNVWQSGTEADEEPSTRFDTTEEAALAAALREPVRAALEALTPRERDAVVLVDLLDYPPEEAARSLGLSPAAGSLRQARRRAHAKLRESLADLAA